MHRLFTTLSQVLRYERILDQYNPKTVDLKQILLKYGESTICLTCSFTLSMPLMTATVKTDIQNQISDFLVSRMAHGDIEQTMQQG